jgi:hypothetical protein
VRTLIRRSSVSTAAGSAVTFAGSFAVVFGSSQLSSHAFRDPHLSATAWWPAAGVALAAANAIEATVAASLLRCPRRRNRCWRGRRTACG